MLKIQSDLTSKKQIQIKKTPNAFLQEKSLQKNYNNLYFNAISPELLKAYYVSFGHKFEKHFENGVTFNYDASNNPTSANVRIFTFPNVQSAEIQIAKNKNSDKLTNIKNEISLDEITLIPLENKGNGIFETKNIDIVKFKPDDRYRFKITFNNGESRFISDVYAKKIINPFDEKEKIPYSMKEILLKDSLTSWPIAYDEKKVELSNISKAWKANKISQKVSATDKKLTNSNALRILQLHIGTFTEKGNFTEAIKDIKSIKNMGFNAIELLPHGFFHNTNWGYDPSYVFASQYGGNDSFKVFCDEAHKQGINVIVDLVNNHSSADHQEIIDEAGPYGDGDIGFGLKMNYTKNGKEEVRDWRINEALYWLENGADAIRFDLTEYTGSDEFLTELNTEIKEHFGAPTIAEDPRGKATNPLQPDSYGKGLENHLKIKKQAQNDKLGGNNIGFDHRWHFDWAHAIEYAVLHPYDRQMNKLSNQIWDAQHQVKALFSHDEIGKQEADGNDIIPKILISKLIGCEIGDLNNATREKQETYWQVSRGIRELLNIYLTGKEWPSGNKQTRPEISKSGKDINDITDKYYGIPDYDKGGLGLPKSISRNEFEKAFENAFSIDKAMMGFLFTQPGPKMIFQSFDKPEKRFSFFRKTAQGAGDDKANPQKGHNVEANEIINQAKLHKYDNFYTKRAVNKQKQMQNLIMALNKTADENPALQNGYVQEVITHNCSAVTAVHTINENNEIYAITNLGDSVDYPEYNIDFPDGNWAEILSTDDEAFGGSGEFQNRNRVINGDGTNWVSIKMPKASTMIFKRVD